MSKQHQFQKPWAIGMSLSNVSDCIFLINCVIIIQNKCTQKAWNVVINASLIDNGICNV